MIRLTDSFDQLCKANGMRKENWSGSTDAIDGLWNRLCPFPWVPEHCRDTRLPPADRVINYSILHIVHLVGRQKTFIPINRSINFASSLDIYSVIN